MEALKNLLKKLNLQSIAQMSTGKKIGIFGGLIAVIVGVVVALTVGRGEEMSYLVLNASAEDTQAITSLLKKDATVEFSVDSRGIKVPSSQLLSLKMKLAQEGLPAHGQVGWEKFDKQDFSMTEFEQNINKLRAIQGELGRTIQSIDGIISARVHIVAPSKSLFVKEEKEATSAIYIKTKRGFTLDQRQIRGIVHLVSRSVEGLKPDNVTIVDGEGNMLTKVESQDASTRMTKEMSEYKRNVERDLEQRIRGIVGRIVGMERVEAKVDATVDFTQEEQTISEVDPDRSAILSSEKTNYSLQGTGLNPTGIPGSKSNVPGEQESVNMATSGTNNKQDSERINYEFPKTVSKRTLPLGSIKRISAGVLVDGAQAYPTDGTKPVFEPRTPEEMKKIEDLVKSAIGFKDNRDEVTVHNMMFQLDQSQTENITAKTKENREYISTLAISSVVALGLVFFFAFIVRPYFRWLAYDPERKKNESIIEEFRPDLEMASIQNVQVKEDVPFEKLTPQEQVMYLAKHEPKRTTEAIRMLLNPHQANHG